MHFYHPETKVLFCDIDKKTARENGLVKSISALTHMLENPALAEYALNQMAMSCLTMPRLEGETDAELIQRAKDESRQERDEAANKGTIIHDCIESILLDKPLKNSSYFNTENHALAYYAAGTFIEIFDNPHIIAVEENYIAHNHKFGCKIDLLFNYNGKICLLDWKTNKFRNDKYSPYESNAWQLAGQSLALADNGIEVDEWYNAGINTNKDSETYGKCQIFSWRKKNGEKRVDLERGFKIIPLLSQVWDILNNME